MFIQQTTGEVTDPERHSDSLPALIQGVGWLLLLGIIGNYFYFSDAGLPAVLTADFVVSMLAVVPFAAVIIVGGFWLGNSDLTSSRYQRVGIWFIGGLGGFLLLNLMMMWTWPAGSLRWTIGWALFAVAVGGSGGLVAGIFEARAISRAVEAERQRLQREAVEQRNERLDEFAAVVAHDLRNPLNVASGQLELERMDRDSEHLQTAATAMGRMETLIDRTLTLARSGHVISETEAVDIGALVDSCWEAVPTGDTTLQNETTAVIDADPDRLRHLFENLFRNAVEHGSTGSRTESDDSVRYSHTGSRPGADDLERGSTGLTIRVGDITGGFYIADNGSGIPPEKREAVLDDGYTTTDGEGGLGLAIVQRIVEAHDWNIDVTESNEGGTRFEITDVTRDRSKNGTDTRSKTPIQP
ncbi:Signal transduction histidine kinase [Haloarcula vallismortis]|uniref:histidine kinase n=3 Tax=Haloarcula vallismortis TaxID=28442 RepID=M0JQA8_HALVA|nr:membrane associated histidine kinase [Haloarcula vallismortis ATCC 29715]SDW96116.1 Signal transduction histidine kinase [Haloarcula vallismortis]